MWRSVVYAFYEECPKVVRKKNKKGIQTTYLEFCCLKCSKIYTRGTGSDNGSTGMMCDYIPQCWGEDVWLQAKDLELDPANNDTLMDTLEILLHKYGFRGRARRVHCFAHTLNLVAKATVCQFKRKKGKKKRRSDEDTPDFDELPLLEAVVDWNESDNDQSMDLPDLEEITDTADDEGPEEAENDEDEIVNVFGTLTEEEQARWKAEVRPIQSALFKVSSLIGTCDH